MFRCRMKPLHLVIRELRWIQFKSWIVFFSKYRNMGSICSEKCLNLPISPHLFFLWLPCTEPWLFPSGAGKGPSRVWLQPSRRKGVQHGLIHPAAGRGRAGCQRRESACEFVFSNQFVDQVGLLTHSFTHTGNELCCSVSAGCQRAEQHGDRCPSSTVTVRDSECWGRFARGGAWTAPAVRNALPVRAGVTVLCVCQAVSSSCSGCFRGPHRTSHSGAERRVTVHVSDCTDCLCVRCAVAVLCRVWGCKPDFVSNPTLIRMFV